MEVDANQTSVTRVTAGMTLDDMIESIYLNIEMCTLNIKKEKKKREELGIILDLLVRPLEKG